MLCGQIHCCHLRQLPLALPAHAQGPSLLHKSKNAQDHLAGHCSSTPVVREVLVVATIPCEGLVAIRANVATALCAQIRMRCLAACVAIARPELLDWCIMTAGIRISHARNPSGVRAVVLCASLRIGISRIPRCGAEHLATPRRLVLLRVKVVDSCRARVIAIRPMLVLLKARETGVLATLAPHAILSCAAAHQMPLLTNNVATPWCLMLLGVLEVDSSRARVIAIRPVLVLREASVAGILATPALHAIITCAGALLVLLGEACHSCGSEHDGRGC
mmetsp:Transcript_4223/g.9969  ORF Transcript_4223/g.9969 Transcript_4223/m.9969 type:complete len:276 (+) Transcript_4223:168-995(+)